MKIDRSIAILGGLPGRNIPEIARDFLHFHQQKSARDIPQRITDLIVLTSFVGHNQLVPAIRQMTQRGGRVYYANGSRSSIERVLKERVLPALRGGAYL